MADSAISAFKAVPTSTITLAVTTTAASVALTSGTVSSAAANGTQALQLYNAGTAIVFVKDGPVGTVAVAPNGAVPGDFPIFPSAPPVVIQFSSGAPAIISAVTASGTGTLYISPGNGI